MPQLITETLLVVTPFKDRGVEYRAGDHVPVRHRRIRQVAREHPSWFRAEYETTEVDLAWLASLDAEAEGRYEAVKRLEGAEKAQRERALRQELQDQDKGQGDLERRFEHQENERKRQEQELAAEREREALEAQTALTSGFHY
jgi:hypothetical protein